tara:strand:+ start:1154 stop:1846 length:693 start_codon:yes stop_codon:yes gene_type:complete
MVSYNHVAKLTYYYENDRKKEFLDLFLSLCGSNNLIDILWFIKEERFTEDNSNIKILYEEKEVIIFKEDFLIGLPDPNPTEHTIDGFTFVLDYPNIIDDICKPMYCIKSISHQNETHNLTSLTDFNMIPIALYNKIYPEIEKYIQDLHNILVYKVVDVDSRFFLHIDLIIKIIYLAFVTSFKNIVDERLFLMKEYNFTYEAFDKMSYLETRHYIKQGIKIINERNNPKTN